MKKNLIIYGIIILFIFIGFGGCIGEEGSSENNPKVINLGDSVIYGTIKLTFLSVDWGKLNEWSSSFYILDVKGENIGKAEDSVFVKITKYEMSNGYTYSDDYIWQSFIIKPGRNKTISVVSTYGLIDKNFLPVAKIYIKLDESANPMLPDKNPIYIVLNV